MIIFLSELQKEHLELLLTHQQSTQVLVDFCKLAVNYLNSGSNCEKYSIAAEKLNVDLSTVQNVVHALVYLLVEGCKHNLTEPDFKSSLAIAGFSPDQQEVLLKLFSTKKAELSDALCILQQRDPSYQDFTWRFEVQIASMTGHDCVKPMVAMDFILMTPKNFRSTEGKDNFDKVTNVNKYLSPVHVDVNTKDAKAASHCLNVINHVFLQSDLPNLVHLTNKLDQALKESKSQHVRKVNRVL